MMLEHSFGRAADARLIEDAVEQVLARGIRTPDIAPEGVTPVTTAELGDAVVAALEERQR